MPADILLDDPQDGWTTVQGDILRAQTTDLMLDSPERRSTDVGERRALVHDTNDGLTINYAGDYPSGVKIQGDKVKAESIEFKLDSPGRRLRPGGSRRALVHDEGDGLTINHSGDYPGGVTIRDARLHLRVVEVQGTEYQLPAHGTPGELVLTHNTSDDPEYLGEYALWVCIGVDPSIFGTVWWARVPFGDSVAGTV
jgi:hypothetical protein